MELNVFVCRRYERAVNIRMLATTDTAKAINVSSKFRFHSKKKDQLHTQKDSLS